jgi:DNA-binding HxlR family transcriptional regulator
MPAADPRPCSIASALSLVGEKWTLLVIREIGYGVVRFGDIARNTGAPRDILTTRLRRLEEAGIVRRRPYQEHPPRFEYHLTRAGEELRPVLLSLHQWGDRWASDSPPLVFEHACGHDLELAHTCRACGRAVTGRDVDVRYLTPGWGVHGRLEGAA